MKLRQVRVRISDKLHKLRAIGGMLTFATYFLLKNPSTLRKLREEIDDVCGDRPITLERLSCMPYLIGESFSLSRFSLLGYSSDNLWV